MLTTFLEKLFLILVHICSFYVFTSIVYFMVRVIIECSERTLTIQKHSNAPTIFPYTFFKHKN